LFFLSTFLCSLGIRVVATTNLEGGSGSAVDLPSFVQGSFKDPKYCSLESSRERELPEGFQTMERGQ
jgi:hypothetical protein